MVSVCVSLKCGKMSTKKRSGRTTTVQFSKMLSFMEKHPDLGLFRMSGPNAKQEAYELWASLTEELNCEVGPEKTSSQWQNTWSDWKVNVKRKWREVSKQQQNKKNSKHLLPIEERLLSLLKISTTADGGRVSTDVGFQIVDLPIDIIQDVESSTDCVISTPGLGIKFKRLPPSPPPPPPPPPRKKPNLSEDGNVDKQQQCSDYKNIECKLDKINETLEKKNDILETISKSLKMQNKLLEKLINKT